jgi:hypothetical protein
MNEAASRAQRVSVCELESGSFHMRVTDRLPGVPMSEDGKTSSSLGTLIKQLLVAGRAWVCSIPPQVTTTSASPDKVNDNTA